MLQGAGLGGVGGENTLICPGKQRKDFIFFFRGGDNLETLGVTRQRRETSFQVWVEKVTETRKKWHIRENSIRFALLRKSRGEDAGETSQADGEGSFTSSVLGSSLPKWRCFQGSEHWLKKKGPSPRAGLFSQHFSSSPCPLFKSSICRKQRSLQFIWACLPPWEHIIYFL